MDRATLLSHLPGESMQPFTREDLQSLLSEHKQPCVTLSVPTRRAPAEWHQNALTFKNLLREAEKALGQNKEWKQSGGEILGKLAALDTQDFWQKQRDALAVFASPDFFRWWQFAESMPALATVAETFHTKGLVKLLQGEVRYYVLALTKENISLFEGNRETLDVVNVPGMPRGMRDLEEKSFESSMSAKTTSAAPGAGGGTIMFGSGRASHTNELKDELKGLFRMVDKALMHVTHDQRAPLILATFDQHHGMFHEVSKNPALLDERIEGDPDKMTLAEIRKRAVALLKPRREQALKDIAATYGTAAAHNRGTNYLPNISKAAVYGRVQTLLIEDGRQISGKLDRKTGEITGMSSSPQADGQDLLDDVGELVLAAGGNVYVLPKSVMPTDVGVAAIYRY
jgi:hypothetical protein